MRLEIKSGSVTTSDSFKEFTFGIKSTDMGVILEILRSKMYKNPIAAICREIASNARDANKEIDNKNPIKINIDEGNIFEHVCEPNISFIDNGPGISPERMADVFVNYGASTKRYDNKQLGGFGLGAKTPFAYTDNFTIITIVNKTKYQYIAAIEENNTGKIYLLEESSTDEPSGTSIIIPIKKDDIHLFKKELIKATYFWPIKPLFNFSYDINFSSTHLQHGILLNDTELFTKNLYVLIDGLPYEIDSDKITSIQYSSYTIMLTFKTGTLAISANRESIRYDENTLKKIQEKYEHFIKSLQEKTQNEINVCSNYYEAALKLHQITQTDELTKVLYDNDIVPIYDNQKVDFNLILPEGLELNKAIKNTTSKISVRQLQSGMTTIYLIDVNKPTEGRNLTIFNTTQQSNFYYLNISNKLIKSFSNQNFTTKKAIAKSFRQIINQIKWFKSIGITIVNYSTIKPTKIIREKRTYSIIPCKILRNSGINFSIYNSQPLVASKINISSITSSTHVYKIYEKLLFPIDKESLKWANVFNICGLQVLFVSNKRANQLSKIINDQQTMFDKLNKTKATEISDIHTANKYKTLIESLSAFSFDDTTNANIKLIKTKITTNEYEYLPIDFLSKYPPSQELQDAIKIIEKIKEKYPLLIKYNDYYDKEKISIFNDYIKLVDERDIYEKNKMVENTGILNICL